MTENRRHSLSDHAFEAVYHPIPQAPVASEPFRPSLELSSEESDVELDSANPPVEVDARIRWIHFVLGCAVLLPWNVMITATPYFMSRLEGSSLQSSFSSYLSTTFTIANFSLLAHATATSKQASNSRRVLFSLTWLALLTALLTASTWFHPPPGVFFTFVLLIGMLQASAGSYLQTAVVAVASLFGHRAMQAVMSGQAAVGVIISGVQVLSAAASTRIAPSPQVDVVALSRTAEENSAALFFGLSTVFLVLTQFAQAWMTKLPGYRTLLARSRSRVRPPPVDSGEIPDETHTLTAGGRKTMNGRVQMLRLVRLNLPYNIAVAYVFVITLSVYPPITISVRSSNPGTHQLLFSAIHFLVYNVGDLLGRFLCSLPRLLVWSARRLLTFALARTLFIPLFLICNIQWSSPAAIRPIITSDVLFMLILLLFGLSNGYVSSMCMMAAPSVTHNPRLRGRTEDVDVAATVASFCLVGGLTLGSFASFAVRAMVCDCNPFAA
ncbi:uncharacterized protein LAESUDRAFT_640138 [Laetiporus sulphureus 93-53]|uniref:Nucleoside transporter n=1 Tax=Laetiporus sulphureus 93-53 TaxID=1314785 RepID=A0A165IC72_9APHY|nr:uncharacterized protein LAESUDRAFT_640138 [Laetiporus sulphureus 93-53]KZT12879.1 hypothetical protein LAESUDRAFT_640138 [Laetiporus sulphureus 93-53]